MASPEPATLITLRRQPVIDYVTKDYDGFRQGMLNQIPLLLPNWTDRSETDFGVVLIELFAYAADILSYSRTASPTKRTSRPRRSAGRSSSCCG